MVNELGQRVYKHVKKFDDQHPKLVHRCHVFCYISYFLTIAVGVHEVSAYVATAMISFIAYNEIVKH